MSFHQYPIYQPTKHEMPGGGVWTRNPLQMVWSVQGGKLGCPIPVKDCREPVPTTKPQPKSCRPCGNSCHTYNSGYQPTQYYQPTGQHQPYYYENYNYYNMEPHVGYYEEPCYPNAPVHVEYSNEEGAPTDAFQIPAGQDFVIEGGKSIWLEQLSNGIRINNRGVASVNVFGTTNSGIIVTNNNTLKDPIFQISVDYNTLVNQGNLVTAVKYNGVTYNPTNGVVDITTAGGAFLQNIVSPNKTVLISSVNATTAGIDIKPPKVNGTTITPNPTDGTPMNLVSGDNTTVSVVDNDVTVDVPSNRFVKRIIYEGTTLTPDSSGQVSLGSGTTASGKYQVTKTLNASDISALTGSGLDLTGVTPTIGPNAPSILSGDLVMLYLNGGYVPRTDYTRSGPTVTMTGVTPTAGQELSWVVIK